MKTRHITAQEYNAVMQVMEDKPIGELNLFLLPSGTFLSAMKRQNGEVLMLAQEVVVHCLLLESQVDEKNKG